MNKELGGNGSGAASLGSDVADAKGSVNVTSYEGKGTPQGVKAATKAVSPAPVSDEKSSSTKVVSVSDSISSLSDYDLKMLRSKKKPMVSAEDPVLSPGVNRATEIMPYRKSLRSPTTEPKDYKEPMYIKDAPGKWLNSDFYSYHE